MKYYVKINFQCKNENEDVWRISIRYRPHNTFETKKEARKWIKEEQKRIESITEYDGRAYRLYRYQIYKLEEERIIEYEG